jgi:glycine oxidase
MRVAVVGAGIIGLACAEELIRGGHDVVVYDPAPGNGATHAAAGMIAPCGEAWHGEGPLLELGLASAALWPGYASRLGAATGVDVGFRAVGTLLIGRDHDDLQEVRRTLAVLEARGLEYRTLDRREVQAQEPSLARVAGGALLPDDHSVDPRAVATALLRVVGDRLVRTHVDVPDQELLLAGGEPLRCDAVVVASGAEAGALVPQVRPVRGETIRLRASDVPTRTLRARVHGQSVYAVPRSTGELVVGASEEEHAGPPTATVGPVLRLLAAARALLPGLDAADILDITARHRPGTPDNGPLLGLRRTGSGLRQVLAVGHYRGGVLLAPLTALVVRAYVEGTAVPSVARPFTPDRFPAVPARHTAATRHLSRTQEGVGNP